MSKKFRFAAVFSIAASFVTTLFSTGGSPASAQGMNAPVAAATMFISQPVVQLVESSTADDAQDQDSANGADSLAELVEMTSAPATLSDELECLAGAIYFEAKGESLAGQLAVGRVVVARSKSGRFPGSYCGVVFQPSQFSFVRGGALPYIKKQSIDWKEAVAIAQIAHEGTWRSPVEGALFFHASRVSPGWRLQRLARVDNHIFYR